MRLRRQTAANHAIVQRQKDDRRRAERQQQQAEEEEAERQRLHAELLARAWSYQDMPEGYTDGFEGGGGGYADDDMEEEEKVGFAAAGQSTADLPRTQPGRSRQP